MDYVWIILAWIWVSLTTFASVAFTIWWMLITLPFVGWIFFVLTLYVLYKGYRMLPEKVQRNTGDRAAPYVWIATRPLRWPIGLWLTSDYDRSRKQAPAPQPARVVERPRRRTMREKLRGWMMRGMRWAAFFIALYLIYAYWPAVWPVIRRAFNV